MKKTILIFLSVILLSPVMSQDLDIFKSKEKNGYKIEGYVDGLQDTSVILAYYFGGKQYATDTANSISGSFTFIGEKKLPGGMYLVVLPNQQYFDIVISEQHFSFTTDIKSPIEKMKFKNSVENSPFYEYLNFITKKQKEVTPLRELEKTAPEEEKNQIKEKILKIDSEVKNFKNTFENKYSNIFFTKILKATTEPIIPEAPDTMNTQEKQIFQFNFYKKSFWNNIDFTDSRMLRTPIFFNKMDTYLNKLTIQDPDSIKKSADVLVKLSRQNKDIFEYVVSYITSTYERSKIMGMDAVFVHMVENYYMTGEVDWVDEKQLNKIEERAEKIAPNLIGRPAPPFINQLGYPFMKNENDEIKRLYDINSKYTLLIFYSPDCGHCKKVVPKVKIVIDSLSSKPSLQNLKHKQIDISVYAVQTEFDKQAWIDLIKDFKLEKWTNVCDIQTDPDGNPAASSNWRDEYDIYSTPVIYLLDVNKKILAKRIDYKQITKVIGRLEGTDK
tara:strand:- start:2181 stop:3680 length:1500 start_codon:yes stop_codon:yes gene_type:complete